MFKKTGFTLIIAQLIAYITCSINGDIPFSNIPGFIGFNFFAIIGIIMLIKDAKDSKTNLQASLKSEETIKEEKPDIQLISKMAIIAIVIISIVIYVYASIFGLI